jgi:hypothetical protein
MRACNEACRDYERRMEHTPIDKVNGRIVRPLHAGLSTSVQRLPPPGGT